MTNSNNLPEIGDQALQIKTRNDFVNFLKTLLNDYQESKDEWENSTIESFLNGLIGFTIDAKGYYSNISEDIDVENPSWRLFADLLLSARIYE